MSELWARPEVVMISCDETDPDRQEVATCPEHGPMAERPQDRLSPEQRFVGRWFRCTACRREAIWHSRELMDHLAGMKPQSSLLGSA